MRAFAAIVLILIAVPAVASDAREEAIRLNEEGIRLVSAGEYEKAIETFRDARKLLPTDLTLRKNLSTAYSEYGTSLIRKGELEKAVKQLRFAVSLEPGIATYHANLGIALSRLGERADAKKSLERAILIDRKCAPAHAELGTIHYKEGSLRLAVKEWEAAVALAPGRKDLEEALERAKRELAVESGHSKKTSAHFEISWDGDKDASTGNRVLRILEDAYEQVGVELGIYPTERIGVTLYSEKEFKVVTGAQDWVAGLYDGRIRVPVKNFSSAEREIRNTLFHEFTHVAVGAVTKTCPAWLNEGLAQHFEGKDPRTARYLAKRAKDRLELFSLDELRRSFTRFKEGSKARLAYAQSLSITKFLIDEHGPDRIGRFLRLLGAGQKEGDAAETAFHRSLKQIYLAWEDEL